MVIFRMYIYGSYRKIKTGVPLFWTTRYISGSQLFWPVAPCRAPHPPVAPLSFDKKRSYILFNILFVREKNKQHNIAVNQRQLLERV